MLCLTLKKTERLRLVCMDTGKVLFIRVVIRHGQAKLTCMADKSYEIKRVSDE